MQRAFFTLMFAMAYYAVHSMHLLPLKSCMHAVRAATYFQAMEMNNKKEKKYQIHLRKGKSSTAILHNILILNA